MKAITLMFGLMFISSVTQAITVDSCDRKLVLEKPPERAVSHDINMTEMMFALGLQSRMVGYSGISGYQKLTDEFKHNAKDLPQLAEKSPSMENLLAVNADFLFAGWNYGMRPGGQLTPHTLKPFGIAVYELSESCIHITKKKDAGFSDVYNDLLNLGAIFDVQARANALVESLKNDLAKTTDITKAVKEPVSVFLYDSGQDSPFTSGKYAMPNAMIEAAGGVNIVNDIPGSWATTNWETVAERNPEVIVIVDYGKVTAEQKIGFLKQHPALSHVSAIKNNRFVTITYAEATPGVRNVAATRRMAEVLHPSLFVTVSDR